MRVALALVLLIALATPAEAGFVIAAVVKAVATISAFKIGSFAVGAFLLRTAASAVFSKLALALKKKSSTGGIKTDTTTSGGTTSQKFVIGRTATGGQLAAPPNSYGSAGSTPRAYLVYPLALSIVPGCTLEAVIVDDDYVTWSGAWSAEWGVNATGDLAGYLSIDYDDGSQAVAHAGMLAGFGADPDRPWSADMVGPGTAMAYLRFKYNRELFNGLPSVTVELLGIPLYDPRADSSVGGAGAQRWDDPSTWTQSENLIVMVYNIHRGIDVGAGMVWGGEAEAEDLPLANWFAAMNECDLGIDDGNGGTVPQYRGGIEIALEDKPADVIDELLKACMGSTVEIGGVWKVRVGAPALPTYFLTDDDILISQEQEFDPFPSIDQTYNGITGSYPEPDSLWQEREAPPRYNDEWELEDGHLEWDEEEAAWVRRGRRLAVGMQFPACPYGEQVQRLMQAYIADHRRFRTHQFVLPPEAALLEPLETIGWTSTRYGYSAKVFEITAQTDSLMTVNQSISIRERDQADMSWTPATDLIPTAPSVTGTSPTPAQTVPGWAVVKDSVTDATAQTRRPAIRMTWNPAGAEDARGIQWEIRLAGTSVVALTGSHSGWSQGVRQVSEGILPLTAYEVRALPLVDRAVAWTGWTAVTTDDIRIGTTDLAPSVTAQMESIAAMAGVASVASLSAPGARANQIVFNSADQRLYRWDATAGVWTSTLYAGIEPGSLTEEALGPGAVTARVMAVADLTNLIANGDFATHPGTFWTLTGSAGAVMQWLDGAGKQTGTHSMAIQKPAGASTYAIATLKQTYWAPVEVGQTYYAETSFATNSGASAAGAFLRILWKTAAGADISSVDVASDSAFPNIGSWSVRSGKIVAPAGAAFAAVQVINWTTSTAGNLFVDRVILKRADAGLLLVEGSVLANHMSAGSVTTDALVVGAVLANNMSVEWLVSNRLRAAYLDIDALLTVLPNAGLRYGKNSPLDGADGIYFGVSTDNVGASAFGFAASRTNGSKRQSIQITPSTGLRLVNGRHYVTSPSLPVNITQTATTGIVALPAGTKTLDLTLVGAGGGGASGRGGGVSNNGGGGGTTIVRIYDGATLVQTRTATGGAGGVPREPSGRDGGIGGGGPYGAVGAVGRPGSHTYEEGDRTLTHFFGTGAGASTGYGVGGSGGGSNYNEASDSPTINRGGLGGAAGQVITTALDLSALADPRIEIVIGAAGAGGASPAAACSHGYPQGGAGAAGRAGVVFYTYSAVSEMPADVVPLAPTATGSITKTGTAMTFPDLGAGLWVLSDSAGNDLNIGTIEIDGAGSTVRVQAGGTISFVAAKTPVLTVGVSANRTVLYAFHSMGSWG